MNIRTHPRITFYQRSIIHSGFREVTEKMESFKLPRWTDYIAHFYPRSARPSPGPGPPRYEHEPGTMEEWEGGSKMGRCLVSKNEQFRCFMIASDKQIVHMYVNALLPLAGGLIQQKTMAADLSVTFGRP